MTRRLAPQRGEATPISKASVTIPVPGNPVRFALLGSSKTGLLTTHAKRQQYDIYYEMFRQHPIVRGAVEKISKYSVATGFHFEPEDQAKEMSPDKEKALKLFFRRSNALHLLRLTYKDLLIYGEAFWYIEHTMLETPQKAWRLHPRDMAPILSDDGMKIIAWEYGISPNNKPTIYPVGKVLHFRFDDPDTDLSGLSLLHSLQLTVASDLNAMHFNGNFFENSAQTGMVIIVKTSSGDEAKRNREWLDQNYVGTKNAHRPLLLEGDVDVKSSVNRHSDMQYMEGRILNRQEVMTVLDVPPDKLNIADDRRRDTSGSSSNFQAETISPLQTIVEEEVNNSLILAIYGWNDVMFRHNTADNRSELDQAKLYGEYERIGVMSPNQIAKRLGYPPITGGDLHFIQTAAGLIPVDLVDEVARRLIVQNSAQPVSGLGTDNFGVRNPPKNNDVGKPGVSKIK